MPNALSRRIHRCPVTAFQKMISGKYKLRILWDLQDGPLRYGEIRSGLLRGADGSPPIAPRVLSRELKALAQSGLIARKDYGVVPPKVEYRLTPAGRSFIPVIAEIRKWGARHSGRGAPESGGQLEHRSPRPDPPLDPPAFRRGTRRLFIRTPVLRISIPPYAGMSTGARRAHAASRRKASPRSP